MRQRAQSRKFSTCSVIDLLFKRTMLGNQEFLDSVFATRGIPENWAVRHGNKKDRPTRRCAPSDLLKKLDLKEENYISYSYVLFGDEGGQSDEDVQLIEAVCIDLDAKHQKGKTATTQQIEKVCQLVPNGVITIANGVQVVLRPAHLEWHKNVGDIVALGDYLAKATGLEYDAGCQVRKDGTAAAHRNHTFRGPGWAKQAKQKVIFLSPAAAPIGTTADALQKLKLKSVEVRAAEVQEVDEGRKETTPPQSPPDNLYSVSRIRDTSTGSMALQKAEYSEILDLWCLGVYDEGKPRKVIEAEICRKKWHHHEAVRLAKSLASLTVYTLSDGTRLSDAQWSSVQKDLEDLKNWIGPRSQRRRSLQRTSTLRANRAWSFEFLYWFKHSPIYKLTLTEAIAAFWSWPEFQTVREMSMAAFKSAGAVEDDLKRCWDLFSDKSTLVSKKAVEEVEIAVLELKRDSFTRADVGKVLPEMSKKKMQRALAELFKVGKIKKRRAGRSTSYSIAAASAPQSTRPPKPAREFKKTPTVRPVAPLPKELEKYMAMAFKGSGDGHRLNAGELHTIKNRPRFEELYTQVFSSVSCNRDGDHVGPSIARLYGFLARACPSGFDAQSVYRKYSGGDTLSDLICEKTIPSDEFLDQDFEDLYPNLLDAADIEIVKNAGGVVLKDFGSLAVKYAAESIEAVLTPEEMTELMESLHRAPWLRTSMKSLTSLHSFGYQKLKKWFSDQLGQNVRSLYLGPKPHRSGEPFSLKADGKELAAWSAATVWSERTSPLLESMRKKRAKGEHL